MAPPVHVHVSTHVDAPRDLVWSILVDLDAQPLWMRDALDVRLVTDPPLRVGSRIEAPTRIAGLYTKDAFEVIGFTPPSRWAIEHQGIFKGEAEFTLTEAADGGTDVSWSERLVPPLGLLGALAMRAGDFILRRQFSGDLSRLKRLAESEARRQHSRERLD